MAWNLATYLVVPVLVVEGVDPLTAIKRSASLLKQTWGEQIAGNFGIGLIFGLLTVVVFLLGIPAVIFALAAESVVLVVFVVVALVLLVVFINLISTTLNGIYIAAVYRYAAEGESSGFFSEEMVQGAFRVK
jgi:cobalamin biosynthesis protein CobD/CbiB